MKNVDIAIIIAPYSPPQSELPNLGAARKIEAMVRVANSVTGKAVLINSSHDSTTPGDWLVREVAISGVPVCEVVPPRYFIRSIGKFLNLLASPLVSRFITDQGRPVLVWIYNAYCFELVAANILSHKYKCPILHNFEDWHFSRVRNGSPKPLLDWLTWKILGRRLYHSFCVNEHLQRECEKEGISASLLPGIVPTELSLLPLAQRVDDSTPIVVGYFGGLSAEKGVDVVISAIALRPLGMRFLICGSGPLVDELKAIAQSPNSLVELHSGISSAELTSHIARCDVLLNPHMVNDAFLQGVFPSKVVEAIGSGRALVSTALQIRDQTNAFSGIFYFDGSPQDMIHGILRAARLLREDPAVVAEGRAAMLGLYSEQALRQKVFRLILGST